MEEKKTTDLKVSKLSKQVKYLEKYADNVENSFIALERDFCQPAQYGQRESIEILNIPEDVSIHELENKLISILECIDVKVNNQTL